MVYVIHVQDDVQCGYLFCDYYISDDVRLAILGGVENARTYDSRSDAEKVVGRMREKYSNIASDTTINIEEYIKQPKPQPPLKPCPCCGSENILLVEYGGCECWNCGLTMPNRRNWREYWNKRAIE